MTKANEVIVDALEEIIVKQDEAPVEPADAQAAIRVLNDMMAMWAIKGINLGYTVVSNLADPITVAPGAIMGMKAWLAIYLAPKYSIEIPQSLIKKAKDGWDAILNLVVQSTPTPYPSTLPQGSGNTYPGYASNTFYPDQLDLILEETGGAIALEEDT